MKVQIMLDFGKVKPDSKRGKEIADAICEELDTMRIAFDAKDIYAKLVKDNASITDEA